MTIEETVQQLNAMQAQTELAIGALTTTGKRNYRYPLLINGILRDVRNLYGLMKVNITDPEGFSKIMADTNSKEEDEIVESTLTQDPESNNIS